MKVKKTGIPPGSMLHKYLPVNYFDAFRCEFETDKEITPDDLIIAFWTIKPKWLEYLFKVRNLMVRPFGLVNDTDAREEKLIRCIKEGEDSGFTSIAGKSDNETILLLSDKHLDAYLSIYLEDMGGNKKKATITTLVRFHYWLGYAYFYAICPFHHVVVRGMMKAVVKQLI